MANRKTSNLMASILYIALGILLVIFKAETINWAMTIAGIIFIISGILEVIKKEWAGGAVSLVIGIVILVLGNLLKDIVLLVLGILIAVKGVVSLIEEFKKSKKSVIGITFAILTVLVGIVLAFGNGLEIMLLVCGIVFIVDGVLGLISTITSKK
jgi:uncharacterized membrane protein HdeD (DUF308 family)